MHFLLSLISCNFDFKPLVVLNYILKQIRVVSISVTLIVKYLLHCKVRLDTTADLRLELTLCVYLDFGACAHVYVSLYERI